jgi:plastocyanin
MVSVPQGAGNQSGAPGYSPDEIAVVIGVNNTVTWTNNDNVHHTVTSASGNGSLNSGDMAPGATYTFTFSFPGTYDYHCVYHSWMTGSVVVKESAIPSPEFPGISPIIVLLVAIVAAALMVRLRPRTPRINTPTLPGGAGGN